MQSARLAFLAVLLSSTALAAPITAPIGTPGFVIGAGGNTSSGPWINMAVGQFALVANSTSDQSATVQAALNACGTAGGGQLIFPAGVFYVQGLSRPNQCSLVGMAPKANTGATILRLVPNSTNYIIADNSYINNLTTATQGGGAQDLTLDGNYTNGTATGSGGALYILRAFNSTLFRLNVINSPGHGILITDLSANGTSLPASGSLSANYITYSNIKLNSGAAIRGVNGVNNRLADLRIVQNSIGTNGQAGLRGSAFGTFCSIHLDRAAGMNISLNEEFGNPNCSLNISQGSQLVFVGNYIDASVNQAASGTIISSTIMAGSDGNVVIVGNTFKNIATTLGGAAGEVLLNINDNATGAGGTVVDGNTFESDNVALTSLSVTGTALATVPVVIGANSYSTNSPPLVWTVSGTPAPKIPNCGPQSDNLYYSVSDLTSTTIGSTAAGGGTHYGAVRCNGNTGNWQIVGN